MSKITRATSLLFGSSAGANQIAQFGSLAASTPNFTTSPATIQALSNYLTGWFAAVIGANSPAIEDMNALCYLFSYQLTYMLQTGVPEYDSATPYFIGSICQDGVGNLFVSLTNSNTGNALTSVANWAPLIQAKNSQTVTGNTTLTTTNEYTRCNAVGSAFTITLPAVASTPVGFVFTIKKVDNSNANAVTVQANASELIDFANTYVLAQAGDSCSLRNTGTLWDVV